MGRVFEKLRRAVGQPDARNIDPRSMSDEQLEAEIVRIFGYMPDEEELKAFARGEEMGLEGGMFIEVE